MENNEKVCIDCFTTYKGPAFPRTCSCGSKRIVSDIRTVKPASDINSLYREIIINLVTLAIKTNDVVIQGSYSGSISDEVNGLLTLCNEIKEQYVEESN